MNPHLLLAVSYAFAAAVQPGPLQAYLVSQTMINGWRRTVPATLAPLISDVPIVCLVLLVLTQVPPGFVNVLRLGGGFYLLYLAFQALQSYRRYTELAASPPSPIHLTVGKAVLVNILNPNPYLGWALIMGPLFLKAWDEGPDLGIAVLVLFYMIMILTTAGILALFAATRSIGPRIARVLVGLSAIALFGFALFQLWTGLTALVPPAVPPAHTAL